MLEAIRVSTVIPASAERIYQAWLDSAEHSAFTGGPAEVDPKIGGRFTAWDGYIEGVTLELEPGRRIVQSWRSSDFPNDADDSRLEVILDEVADGATEVTFVHSDIPEGQGKEYEQGWFDHYFEPMKSYFAGGSLPGEAAGGDEGELLDEYPGEAQLTPPTDGEEVVAVLMTRRGPVETKRRRGPAAEVSTRRGPVKRAAARAVPSTKGPAGKGAPKAKRAPAAQAAPVKKAPAKRATATKTPAAKRAPAAKSAPAKKMPATKRAPAKKTAPKKAPAAPKKAPAKKAAPKKAAPKKAPAKPRRRA